MCELILFSLKTMDSSKEDVIYLCFTLTDSGFGPFPHYRLKDQTPGILHAFASDDEEGRVAMFLKMLRKTRKHENVKMAEALAVNTVEITENQFIYQAEKERHEMETVTGRNLAFFGEY